MQAAANDARATIGLYRLADATTETLIYIGQGRIQHRLRQHLANARISAHRQTELLGRPHLRCSWVSGEWSSHQRLELENDLIANHMNRHGRPPLAQFLG